MYVHIVSTSIRSEFSEHPAIGSKGSNHTNPGADHGVFGHAAGNNQCNGKRARTSKKGDVEG